MNTLKSAALVVVLAGVLVAVYVTVYQPPVAPPPGMTQQEVDDLGPPLIEEDAAHEEADTTTQDFPLPHSSGPSALTGSNVAPPGAPELEERSPADPATGADARSAAHTVPVPESLVSRSVYEPQDDAARPASPPYDLAAAAERLAQHNFKRDFEAARRQVDEGLFRAALATLSPYYGRPELTEQQHADLTAWLDALAAKVIYSPEHLLTQPYRVRGSQERMIDVAQKCGVSTQLLQNINAAAVNNPDVLLPGTVLKVVPGPFRAEINLARGEITIFLTELYAGRFPIALGDEPVLPGQYQVQQKQYMPTYVSSDGRTIAGNDPANPYGGFSLNLNSQVRIHGSPLISARGQSRGCISLSPKDAEDLFGILTEGSIVAIK